MKYCVIKNTTKVIDGSDNPIEFMLKNAQNAGYSESEVEILSKEEYEARKALEPKSPIVNQDEVLKSKIEVATINTLIDLGVI